MRVVRVTAALLFVAGSVMAQTNRGGIVGTVFDPTGAAIPGATVVVTNVGTNQEIQVQTSRSGSYSVSPLDPVIYRVTVTAPGFQKAILTSVKVDTASIAKVDVKLRTGAMAEEISVVAEAPLVNAESGTPGQTITERQIVEMPLNNRSVLDLAMTVGNVSGMAGTEDPSLNPASADLPTPGYNMFINGGRAGSTSILADGARNTGVGIARALVTFSPDTVQEFTVQTSNFSAEYGQTGGGVINMTTKQGTNAFEGLLYWYHRNPALGAAPFTTAVINRPEAKRLQHQLGLTLGGPVRLPKPLGYDGRDKTFFFFALEPRYYRDEYPDQGLVATEAMRNGDFRNLCSLSDGGFTTTDVAARLNKTCTPVQLYNQFDVVTDSRGKTQFVRRTLAAGQTFPVFPNNQIPANMIDPVSQEVLKRQALPNSDYFLTSTGTLANYNSHSFIENRERRLTVRVDHQLSDRDRLSARYTQVPIRGDRGRTDFEIGRDEVNTKGTDYSSTKQALLTHTHMFSTAVVNDLRLNYTYGRFSRTTPPMFDMFSGRSWTRELGLPGLTPGGISTFEIGPLGYVGWAQSDQNENTEYTINVADNLTWVKGSMTWKAGFDLAHMRMKTTPTFVAGGGRYAYSAAHTNSALTGGTGGLNYASFLMGVYNNTYLRDSLFTYDYRWISAAAFVQNDWKVHPSLTLNIGFRYTLQLPRTEANNMQGLMRPDKAKEYTLAKPVTLPSGEVITTALVPSFEFSGEGGRSRYLTPTDWNGWEPRFGFAWVPKFARDKLILRGGYGLSHLPITGMGRTASPDFAGFSNAWAWNNLQTYPEYVARHSTNPPYLVPLTIDQLTSRDANGVVDRNSLAVRGFNSMPSKNRVPYMQSWSTSLSYELPYRTAIEVTYLGSKGTHLYLQPFDINQISYDLGQSYWERALDVNLNVDDPLGRLDANGRVLRYGQGYLGTKYMGFSYLRDLYNPNGGSRRNAVSVSLRRQHTSGLSFTLNYTYGKGYDDASTAGSVRFVDFNSTLSPGHMNYGAPRSDDWSVSSFDIKHAFSGSFLWDIPIGRGRALGNKMPGLLDGIFGGWSVSGVGIMQSGPPLSVVLTDANGLGASNARAVRPNLVPGVPLKNPLYSKDCPVGATCEPYFNPAAFMRPPKGTLGNAPRTIDEARWPSWNNLDLSVQKSFRLGKDGKRRLQLRVDFINALNHPNFRMLRDSDAGNIFGAPSENLLTTSEYNSWASYPTNNKPAATTPGGAALMAQANAIVTRNRIPGTTALRPDFFSVPVPQGFHSADARSFDITTEEGLKLYRLRQQYSQDRWGSLLARSPYEPRFIQLGVKLYF